MTDLPKIKDVFFIHYQCDDFEIGTQITSLGIYTNSKVIEFSQGNEIEIIEKYCDKVTELCNQGLIPIHWNQNRPTYGIEHITARYNELTGNIRHLEYTNEIDLSIWLKDTYGYFYIRSDGFGRLDNLAILNNFNGIRATQKNERTFDTNRLLLLMKIFRSASNNTLITDINKNDYQQQKTLNPEEGYKNQNLFKIGLLFATGEMNKYFSVTSLGKTVMKEGYSAPKIAEKIGNNGYNKWILATINNYAIDNVNGNKNIFNSVDMMTKIIDHCNINNIKIDPYFISRLPID